MNRILRSAVAALLVVVPTVLIGAAPMNDSTVAPQSSLWDSSTRIPPLPRQAVGNQAMGAVKPAVVPSVILDWCSINNGGATAAASASFKTGMSVGQFLAGEASSASFKAGIGFWYGTDLNCSCPCHGDPQCDGIRCTVQDVVKTVDVAFRGAARVFDPQCPRERTDVNCDGFTTVQDVVKVVNVAFRGASATTQFCDPCAP